MSTNISLEPDAHSVPDNSDPSSAHTHTPNHTLIYTSEQAQTLGEVRQINY